MIKVSMDTLKSMLLSQSETRQIEIILHKANQIQTLCQRQVKTRDTRRGKAAVTVLENLHEKGLSKFFLSWGVHY